jgi:drug/metabolite transporter (DMT)-like permease
VATLGPRAWRPRAVAIAIAGSPSAVALACAGAACYGVTVVIGRRLAQGGLAPATALGIRFAVAAAVLRLLLALRGVPRVPRRRVLRTLALGAIGYAGQSTLFYMSLQRGTAATSILLFYAYPALVCAIGWVALRERRPSRRTCAALVLSAAGTGLVACAGGPVTVDPVAVAFALGSALVFALYMLAGQRLARGVDAMTTATWVATGAAIGSAGQGVLTKHLPGPGGHWALLAAYGLFTAAAFTLMFAALARLGARHTSVVMTLEAVFAVALAVLLLGERVGPGQAVGGVCVLAATVVVTRTRAAGQSPRSRTPSSSAPRWWASSWRTVIVTCSRRSSGSWPKSRRSVSR